MGAYKHDLVAEIQMGAYVHGAYFVRVLIIPILRYLQLYIYHKIEPSINSIPLSPRVATSSPYF